MQKQNNFENQTNLQDVIRVMVKRKKIIFSIFFIGVITTLFVSLSMPSIYRASASIIILPSKILSDFSAVKTNLVKEGKDSLSPNISLPTHLALLKSKPIIEGVISELKLKNDSGMMFTTDDLSRKLNIKDIRDTNIINLVVEDSNPTRAMEIANAWVKEYIEYNTELILGEIKGTGDFIAQQFKIAKDNLTQAENKIFDFNNKYNLDLMESELSIKKYRLDNNITEIVNLETNLKTDEETLKEVKKAIEKQDKFIIISKAISDDVLWTKDGNKTTWADLDKKKLRSEEINPIYQGLEERIINTEIAFNILKQKYDYLRGLVDADKKEIIELERNINEKKYELTQLNRQVDIFKKTYDNFADRLDTARITKTIELGEVKIISLANKPTSIIGPNRKKHLIFSAIASLIIGIFLAFSFEYWQKSISACRIPLQGDRT